MTRKLILALALIAGCSGDKAPVDDTFSDLAGADEKSDKFTGRMTIIGSISYGETKGPFGHARGKWSALKFAGDEGDRIVVDVGSKDGDTVAWVLDNDFNILGFNDDLEKGNTNSHIALTLPKSASRTHYIVVRDYYKGPMKFVVTLQSYNAPCQKDADCVLVNTGCCGANFGAVRADQEGSFRNSLQCSPYLRCATAAPPRDQAALCLENRCVMVAAADIACGGHTINPHECPADYVCEGKQMAYDAPGSCTKRCGGIRGLACDGTDICIDDPNDDCDPNSGGADCMGVCRPEICSGKTAKCAAYSYWDQYECTCVERSTCGGIANLPCAPGKTCIDDPNDSCDPNNGGADCGGICVSDCRTAGCGDGQFCSFCWGSYQCIPNGAFC